MSKDFNVEKLHENVWLYKNALPQSKEILEYFKNLDRWHPWNFGTHIMLEYQSVGYDEFPDKEILFKESFESIDPEYQSNEARMILENFYDTTKHFIEQTGFTLPNWHFRNHDIAKYEANFNDEEFIQKLHTDYHIEREDEPRIQFGLTSVTYLNDDYEGGDLVFKIYDDETEKTYNIVKYKPSAGDTLVFSSRFPNFHAVRQVTSGEKYMAQLVWRFKSNGSKAWWEGVEKYGEQEWRRMFEEKISMISSEPGYSLRDFDPEYEVLADKIMYFPNILRDKIKVLDMIENTNSFVISDWKEWRASSDPNGHQYGQRKEINVTNFYMEEDQETIDKTKYVLDRITKTFTKGSRMYCEKFNLDSDAFERGLSIINGGSIFGLNKYNVGESMGPHVDKNEMNDFAYYVLALYMNDDYEGGEIRFINEDITIKPESGSLLIFPGTHPFLHEVLEVKSGNKMIINHHLNTSGSDS